MTIINCTFDDQKMPTQYKTGVTTQVLKPANPKQTSPHHCKLHAGKTNREGNVTRDKNSAGRKARSTNSNLDSKKAVQHPTMH